MANPIYENITIDHKVAVRYLLTDETAESHDKCRVGQQEMMVVVVELASI